MKSNIRKITGQMWGAVVAGGLVSVLFGLATMLWPRTILSIFIYLFSVFILVVSVVALGRAFSNMDIYRLWWLQMLAAICGICVGVFFMTNPNIAQGLIAVLLAIYILTQALMDLIVASYTDEPGSKTSIIATGVIGVIFGFLVLFQPQLSTEALVWVIGLYILIHGALVEFYAVRVRRTVRQVAKDIRDAAEDMQDDVREAEIVNKPSTKKATKEAGRKNSTKKSK